MTGTRSMKIVTTDVLTILTEYLNG